MFDSGHAAVLVLFHVLRFLNYELRDIGPYDDSYDSVKAMRETKTFFSLSTAIQSYNHFTLMISAIFGPVF